MFKYLYSWIQCINVYFLSIVLTGAAKRKRKKPFNQRGGARERGAHTGYRFFLYIHKIFAGVNIPSKSYIIGKTILGWCQLYFIHSMIWGCNLTIFFLCMPQPNNWKKTSLFIVTKLLYKIYGRSSKWNVEIVYWI